MTCRRPTSQSRWAPWPDSQAAERWRTRSCGWREGKTDEEIAGQLTQDGFRSPRGRTVLPSTVQLLRLSHGLMRDRHQSHPRQIPGFLTVPQVAMKLNIPRHWIYDRIHNGTIQIDINFERRTYLFPDTPETLARFRQLRAGDLNNLRF